MKKYLQITIVLVAFVVAVTVHRIYANESQPSNLAAAIGSANPAKDLATPAVVTPAPPEPVPTGTRVPSLGVLSRESDDEGENRRLVPPALAATPTPAPTATAASRSPAIAPQAATATPQSGAGPFKDGTYDGSVADARYGPLQVRVIITSGKISDVRILLYPDHANTSVRINYQALPWLRDEALQAQTSNVDIIGGASATSFAFQDSLAYALKKAS